MSIPVHCAHTALVDPNALKPNPVNPNRHSAHQIQLLASIIQEQGWRNPVTVSKRSGLIVRGHGRLEAALLIGCETIPVDEQDYASEAEELADLLADNRLSELAELDEDDLRRVLKSIGDADPSFDIELTGFMEDEIRKLMEDEATPRRNLKRSRGWNARPSSTTTTWSSCSMTCGTGCRCSSSWGCARLTIRSPAEPRKSASAACSMENDSSNSAAEPAWPEFRPLKLRLVILSRSRSRSITSHKLFPTSTLLVPASEADHYRHTGLEIETIPDEIAGISAVRNWVLRHFKDDAIVMLDDDISACVCMVSLRCRKLSIAETIAMLENSAWCARGAGARLFGWHQRSDPRLLQRNDPFGVNHWVGGAVGVVRDEKGGVPKWDELLKCKCDIDATLQELMDNRLVWNEARFCFVQERDKNLGGNSLFRSEERIATEKRYLKRKWKAHIRLETYKSQDRVAMDAPRRQSVKL